MTKRRASPAEHQELIAAGWERRSNWYYLRYPHVLVIHMEHGQRTWMPAMHSWHGPDFASYQAALVYAEIEGWGQ